MPNSQESNSQDSTYAAFKFVSDIPADEDQFGRSHDRVAQTIAKIICNELGGKTIGLEGTWGSGKSTVIRLLSQKLAACEGVNVIVFDAWAHEGDYLRRSFLECLIANFISWNWVGKKQWNERKEELARRRKKYTSTTTPQLTKFGISVLLSFLLVPFGQALLTSALRPAFSLESIQCNVIASIVLSIICIGAPMFLSLFYLMLKSPNKSFSDLAIFLNKVDSCEVKEVIENPDPSSIEFEQIFFELMKEGIIDKRKLVLVVDNLDRISPKDALCIWSTLRSFLEYHDIGDKNYLNRIWVIVPHDREGLAKIWESASNNGERNSKAVSFLDKVFQLRTFVPLPVLSDWKEYFITQMKYSFPKEDENEIHKVYAIYEMQLRKKPSEEDKYEVSLSPTPREIKLFINGIGGIYSQWYADREYPLSHIALFYLIRAKESNGVLNVIYNPSLVERELFMLGESILDSLAGLNYNVDIKRGRQIRMKDKLVSAMENSNEEELKKLMENTNGCEEVIESILVETLELWALTEGEKIALAARNLLENAVISLGDNKNVIYTDLIWNNFNKTDKFTDFNKAIALGLIAVSELRKNENSFQSVLKRIPSVSGGKGEILNTISWISGISEIFSYALENNYEESLEKELCCATDSKTFRILCETQETVDFRKEFISLLRPQSKSDLLSEFVEEIKRIEKEDKTYFSAFKVLFTQTQPTEWKKIVDVILERSAQCAKVELAEYFISLLFLLRQNNMIESEPNFNERQSGILLHHFYNAISESNVSVQAKLLRWYLMLNPAVDKVIPMGNSGAGKDQVDVVLMNPSAREDLILEVIKNLVENQDYHWVIKIISEGNQSRQKFVETIIRKFALSRKESLPKLLPIEVFVKQLDYLYKMLEGGNETTNIGGIVALLADDNNWLESLMQYGFKIEMSRLYNDILKSRGKILVDFRKWCSNSVKKFNKDEWYFVLDRADFEYGIDIIQSLVELDGNIELPINYIDALRKLAIGAANGGEIPKEIVTRWSYLVNGMSKTGKDELGHGLTQDWKKIENHGSETKEFFMLFGDFMLESGDFSGVEKVINSILLSISRSDIDNYIGVEWVAKILKKNPEWLVSDEENESEFLRRRLEDVEDDPNVSSEIKDLLSQVPFERRKINEITQENLDGEEIELVNQNETEQAKNVSHSEE